MGPGKLLRRAIQADLLSSIILYGPPGTGKTTLARVIAGTTRSHFETINAVLAGVKEIRETIQTARELRSLHDRKTILFVDEVHRWNKSQQDALLPWVENGTLVLIGATIENPYFEVNRALVSRSRIFQLKPLLDKDIRGILEQALSDPFRGYGKYKVSFEEKAMEHLVKTASGDARSALNALQLAVETTPDAFPPEDGSEIYITLEIAEESIQKKAVLYDKEGDYHYDTISAFIKSLRGSDPDAALYWMAKMIAAGERPQFIFRRMLIFASEDVGLADPLALSVAQSAADAFDRVGMPEGRFFLSQACLYLSTCPKSNSAFAFFDALKSVEEEASPEVPNHLRDGNRDKKGFGHGEGYLYPHAYKDHWVAQNYLPSGLQGRVFYRPGGQGYEAEIEERVNQRRELQLTLALEEESQEVLTYSGDQKERNVWISRALGKTAAGLSDLRQDFFELLDVGRHHTVLDLHCRSGLLLWEALRRAPEGGVYGFEPRAENRETMMHFVSELGKLEKPMLYANNIEDIDSVLSEVWPQDLRFDRIMGFRVFLELQDVSRAALKIRELLGPQGLFVLAEFLPSRSPRLSQFVLEERLPAALGDLEAAECEIYSDPENLRTALSADLLLQWLETAQFTGLSSVEKKYASRKWISPEQVNQWFGSEAVGKHYGSWLKARLGEKTHEAWRHFFIHALGNREVPWERTVVFVKALKA